MNLKGQSQGYWFTKFPIFSYSKERDVSVTGSVTVLKILEFQMEKCNA
jgi:hypothetical protein